MRIAILATAFAAVFSVVVARADDAQPNSNGIIDLTNVKCLCDRFKLPTLRHSLLGSDDKITRPPDSLPATVVLTYLIGTDGQVSDEKIVFSSKDPDFDAKVLAEFAARSYRPATLSDKPVAVRVATRAFFYRNLMVGLSKDTEADIFIFRLADWIRSASDPSADYYMVRGHDDDVSGNHEAAITDFEQAFRANPRNEAALRELGFVREELGKYEDAVKDDTAALSIKSDYSEAIMDRAFAYDALGKHDLAVADYKLLDGMAPSCAPARTFTDTKCHAAFEGRITTLDKRIAENADDINAYTLRCAERAIAGAELNKALADCNKTLDRTPDDVNALAMRALVFYRMGIFPSALKDLDASLVVDPHADNNRYLRGIVKIRMNEIAAGRDDIFAARAQEAAVTAEMLWGLYP